jgi:hypothetical protein
MHQSQDGRQADSSASAAANPALKIVLFPAVALSLSACVAGSGESAHAASGGMLSQFFLGLWHGIIGPVTLVIEIVNRLFPHALPWRAHLFETKATGVAYDVGFYLGLADGPTYAISRR